MVTAQLDARDASSKATVLVVEDDPILRYALASEVHAAGFRVLEAACADEAETVLATGAHVDLVVTDIQMPGPRDGLALARGLREFRPHIKVIVASGALPHRSIATLADAYFDKPYDTDVVIQRIRALIGLTDGSAR